MTTDSQPSPDIHKGDYVRYPNYAGPCMKGHVAGIGRSRYKIDQGGGLMAYAYFFEVHTTPCLRCTDHPKTYYPRGYEG